MFDLDDPIPLSVTVYDNGTPAVPANAGNVALTITAPTAVYVVDPVAPTSAGVYSYTFTPTEAGRHTARWVATGANACAYTDAFDVDDAAASGIVSLADAREKLNITATTSDEELRGYIDEATDFVEGIVGPVVRRTYTETRTPRNGRLALSHWSPGSPVTLVSVVGANGYAATLNVTTLHVTDAGILEPNYGAYMGYYPLTVTYSAGWDVIPGIIRGAALDYVKWAWESQRGPSGAPFQGEEFADQTSATPPYKIAAKLARYRPAVVA